MKILVKSGLLAFIFLISVQVGYSCVCVKKNHKEEIEKTDYVFVGKVIEVTEDKTYVPPKFENASPFLQNMIDTRKRYLIKFKIENNFKGVKENEITIVKYEQGKEMPCGGLTFVKNKKYLIYAYINKEKEEIRDTGICSRTQFFDRKSEDYKELLNLRAKKQIETTK